MSDESSDSTLPLGNKRRPRLLSTSDSDDSDVPIRRVKKCRTALSSDSEDSSSGSSVLSGLANRRLCGRRPLDDLSSEWESTSGDSDEGDRENSENTRRSDVAIPNDEDSNSLKKEGKTPKNKSLIKDSPSPRIAGNVSDTSDGNSEKCPICLLTFSNQDIGTPETCEHLFCSDCITEWSKNVNTCPVDRLTFSSILVRRKIGGKVVKTIAVNPRISSDEDYIFEDTTFCEICHLSTSEETMLLCDSCDLGYHMHCLEPPLMEVPENEWFCPECSADLANRQTLDLVAMTRLLGARLRRMSRSPRGSGPTDALDENMPSTSGHTSNASGPTSSRRGASSSRTGVTSSRSGVTSSRSGVTSRSSTTQSRRTAGRPRATTRRRRRRRTRNVVVEYEIREGEKFPIKTKKKAVKRRRRKATRKAPRTAARRALVRSSVRNRLAEQLRSASSLDTGPLAAHSRLAVPQLSIYGNRNELDYFVEEDEDEFDSGFGRGGSAVAVAPRSLASAILDSHRQIRRKMISIPSPTYASSAPDILSSILESQSLLHSKHTSFASNNGKKPKPSIITKSDSILPVPNQKVDVRKEENLVNVKETPGYPGAGRGGGGGGGGGSWRAGQGGGGGRGGNHPYSGGDYSTFSGEGSAFQGNRPFQSSSPWQNNNASDHFQHRDRYDNYPDRSPMQRGSASANRGRSLQSRYGLQMPQRSLPSSPWQNQMLPDLSRSFPGRNPNYFPPEVTNPVDMTTGHDPGYNLGARTENYSDVGVYRGTPNAGQNVPLTPPPQPPIIRFQKPPLSEDEKSDSSLPTEADKYDPMEPTLDDSSSEEDNIPRPVSVQQKLTIVSPPRKDSSLVADYVSGSDSPGLLKVSSNILDQAVQQVLKEHKDLMSSHKLTAERESGGDSDGDCPNFSIYSSTSMDIAKNRKEDVENEILDPAEDQEEDLVQQDDRESIGENCKADNSDIDLIPVPSNEDDILQNDDLLPETKDDAFEKQDDFSENVDESFENDVNNYSESEENVGVMTQNDNTENKNALSQCKEDNDLSKEIEISTEKGDLEKDTSSVECEEQSGKDESLDVTSKDIDTTENISVNMNPSISPIKKTQITIKLLTNRSINKGSFDLYDKEDYDDVPPKPDDDKAVPPEQSNNSEIRDTDEDTNNSSLDEEIVKVKDSQASDLLPADIEKLTESISDAEDERSYTPCLDENKSNKSKDTTFDSEKETTGIGGLDTEMISDDEGNEIFSDTNNIKADSDGGALELLVRDTELQQGEFEEGEIVEKRKQKVKEKVKALLNQPEIKIVDDEKKKKKKDKRTEKDVKDKDKSKGKKTNEDASFKKLSKSGKERNYRERDDKNKSKNKDKDKEKRTSRSPDKERKDKNKDKKRDKRKDIERYDVRNIISDKSRRVKDAFGRDTSRPRSKSADSRLGSPQRFKRSISRKRSLSRGRRSISRGRRSISKTHRSISRGRRSISKKRRSVSRGRRSLSRRRRSISRGRKSLSRNGKSISPRFRRSISPRFRRSISPRHKAHTPKKRSLSPKCRSPIVRGRRSMSPRARRSKSPRIRRSTSRIRNKRNKRSLSRGRRSPRLHRPISPRRRPIRRSKSRGRSISKNPSQSPKVRKSRKLKRHRSNSSKRKMSKSPVKPKLKRKRSRSFSPGVVLSRSPSRERGNIIERPEWIAARQGPKKNALYRDWSSASHSLSPQRTAKSPGWTPPPQQSNLRVILTTKDKSKKKDKKKKASKKNKINERTLQHQQKDMGPSKEVFTSGNNILVSVSFNKNQESEGIPTMPPPEDVPKKKKHKTDAAVKSKKDKNKEKTKKKRGVRGKRAKDLENKKPVAIIDLDKSPFKELTPSPKAIIILSDSENGEKEEELMERQEMLRGELMEMGFPQSDDVESPQRSPVRENAYLTTAGPKTPPEPAVKFTISNKSSTQLRAVNPLHEEEDEAPVGDNAEGKDGAAEAAQRGPNTPPEPPNSPPSSPDAYDPFEPTKSGSATPERVSPTPAQAEKHPDKRPEDLLQVPTMSLEAAQKSNLSADDVIQARPISPMEKVLALLKSTRNNLSPANAVQPLYSEQIYDNPKTGDNDNQAIDSNPTVTVQSPERNSSSAAPVTKTQTVYPAVVKPNSPKLIYSTVTPTVVTSTPGYLNPVSRIGAYTTSTPPSNQRIMLPSPTKSSPLKSQSSKLFMAKPSPIKSTPIKPMPSKTIISKLPMPSIKPLPARIPKGNTGKNGQNGNEVIELDMDMDSPYSPGSSDFGDLFEPPADNGKQSNMAYAQNKPTSKFNVFDSLFGAKTGGKNSNKTSALSKVPVRQMKKSKGKMQVGVRMDEDTLKILDDLPSSAVEMQVKTKFLKKLNRQERVVEEVKLVLKPHYNKKHISKEDYKDILRRAVPKICHNRSGEINPAKIHALIEAYVRKFRKKAHQVK